MKCSAEFLRSGKHLFLGINSSIMQADCIVTNVIAAVMYTKPCLVLSVFVKFLLFLDRTLKGYNLCQVSIAAFSSTWQIHLYYIIQYRK